MAAPRLSDAQKQELVDRFRDGAGTQELATDYSCSPNTVIRVVRAAIEPALYEELKRQRARRVGQPPDPVASEPEPDAPSPGPAPQQATQASEQPAPPAPEPQLVASVPAEAADPSEPETEPETELETELVAEPEASAVPRDPDAAGALAIDDADDFDDFGDDDEVDDDGDLDDEADVAGFDEQTFVEVPISLGASLDQPVTTARPWCSSELPASAYMLVDKTVELQALPLADIPELGRLEAEEQELQALVLYSNPRQAKRHCGRSQRVIKIPDLGLLERRAPYLLRQGICRVVLEGALYALPEG